MYIDPHVHCRDGFQSYKETIAHALLVAQRAGMTAIFDMPNTKPPLLTKEDVKNRIAVSNRTESSVFYGLYLGLTADVKQIESAVDAFNELEQVVGFKLYAGHSVGKMGITLEEEQQLIYNELAHLNYKGVVAVHCEKESLLKPHLWDPVSPLTHASARPPEAEIVSVTDQITFAKKANFLGTLHIAHISVPESVDIVHEEKNNLNITCGVTPHHCLFGMDIMDKPGGILYKMNPPLRLKTMADQMFEYLCEGKIDWVETDHAPHTLDEKAGEPYMSGLPGISFYPRFIEILKKRMTDEQIDRVTFSNIINTFKLNLQKRKCTPDLNLASEYPFDPFKDVVI